MASIDIIEHLSNCTQTNVKESNGYYLDLTITANDGYIFHEDDMPRLVYKRNDGTKYDFNLNASTLSSDKKKIYTDSVFIKGGVSDFNLYATAYSEAKTITITQTLSNCTSNAPTTINVGETLNVVLTANSNTKFDKDKVIPHFSYYNESLDRIDKPLLIADDGLSASGSVVVGNWSNFTIVGDAYPVSVIGGDYGAINVYIVTIDNLNEFATKRFFKEVSTDPTTGNVIYDKIDLGAYVNKIIRIYTNIGSSSTDVIRCGNYNTNISCLQPNTDKITLDFGNITIPQHNENSVDYQNDIKLFLPFSGFVTIPNEYVGKTINLQYVINVLTGNGSALISSDNSIFQIEQIEAKNNILYLSQDTESKTIGSDEWNERLYYGLEPYILFRWYDSAPDSVNNERQIKNINDLTKGFYKVIEIENINNENIPYMDYNNIVNILQGGFYVE